MKIRPKGDPRAGVMWIRPPIITKKPSGERRGRVGARAPTITGIRSGGAIQGIPRLNLRRIPTGDPRTGVIGGRARMRRKPRKKPAPSPGVMKNIPPRKVGVGREQAKIEPAGLSDAISAIVNNIMSMIFGK